MQDFAPCPLDGRNCGCTCAQRARCRGTAEAIDRARAVIFRCLFAALALVGGGVALYLVFR